MKCSCVCFANRAFNWTACLSKCQVVPYRSAGHRNAGPRRTGHRGTIRSIRSNQRITRLHCITKHMRIVCLIACFSTFVTHFVIGQRSTPNRIHLYSPTSLSLITTLDLNKPIQVSHYTLLELVSDSLGVKVNPERVIFFHFDTLKSYYYLLSSTPHGRLSLSPMRRNDFWGKTEGAKAGTYRRYNWDKSNGLLLSIEKK